MSGTSTTEGCRWGCRSPVARPTAAAVIGLAVPGVEVVDVGTTAKTLPDFPSRWHSMLDGVSSGS